MNHRRKRYSTVQYSTVQYSTVQYSTVQYSTVLYISIQYSTVSKVLYISVQYSTVQYSTHLYTFDKFTLFMKLKISFWFLRWFWQHSIMIWLNIFRLLLPAVVPIIPTKKRMRISAACRQSTQDQWAVSPSCRSGLLAKGTMNYPKKTGFNLYQSRYCAFITYSVKTWFLKNLSVHQESGIKNVDTLFR